jgi:hypothetical protein
MTGIIPELTNQEINLIPSKAERAVYKSLQSSLPSNWLVVHSLEFVKQNEYSKRNSDREADFVVFAPEFGILVVEVKGGGIEYDKRIDKWFSIDRFGHKHSIKNPIRQSKDAKYSIRKHMQKYLGNKDVLLAHAALFPDLNNARLLSAPDMPSEILGDADSLSNLVSWITDVFTYWRGKESYYEPFGIGGIRAATQLFGKEVTVNSSLKVALEQETQRQFELTNQQKTILRQLKKRKTALIEGGAGTGKTVLAIDHAQELATIGEKVLFLCYNHKLANSLKSRINGLTNLHIMSYHELCSWRKKQVMSNTGRDLFLESKSSYPNADLFDVIMPDAFAESLDLAPIQYDTIIIDEAQDFKDEYWLPIELMLDAHPDTNFYVFQDCNQAIFTLCEHLPIKSEPLYLFDNCRNTTAIHELAYQFYRGVDTCCSDVAGSPVEICAKLDTLEAQARDIGELVDRLVQFEKIDPVDIVVTVVGSFDLAETLLKEHSKYKRWGFKDSSFTTNVLVETAKRFKGLESKLLILWILNSSHLTDSLVYVATSRARLRLWIYGDHDLPNRLIGHKPSPNIQ